MRVVFRVDAGPGVGLGHIRRCLALAEELRETGCRVAFVSSGLDADSKTAIESLDAQLWPLPEGVGRGGPDDAEFLGGLARDAHWLVLDGYVFDSRYRSSVAGAAAKFMAVSDSPDDYAMVDLVLDQNVGVQQEEYRLGPQGRLLCGPGHCLFKGDREFRRIRGGSPRRVLVTMGGLDPLGLTEVTVKALAGSLWRTDVVIGPFSLFSPRHIQGLNPDVDVHIAPQGLKRLISSADFGIMSLGITTWEMCYYGLPFVMLPSSPLQLPTARWFVRHGLSVVGCADGERFKSSEFLEACFRLEVMMADGSLSRALMQVVDGLGPKRVVQAMLAA